MFNLVAATTKLNHQLIADLLVWPAAKPRKASTRAWQWLGWKLHRFSSSRPPTCHHRRSSDVVMRNFIQWRIYRWMKAKQLCLCCTWVDVRSCHVLKNFWVGGCITWNPKASWKKSCIAMLFRHLRQTLHAFEKFQTLGIEADYIIHIFRWRKKHVHDSPGFSRGEWFLHGARSDDASSDWVRGARSIFRLLLQEDPPLGAPFARRLGDSQQTPHQSTVKSVWRKMKTSMYKVSSFVLKTFFFHIGFLELLF